jgi:hypothetical protein
MPAGGQARPRACGRTARAIDSAVVFGHTPSRRGSHAARPSRRRAGGRGKAAGPVPDRAGQPGSCCDPSTGSVWSTTGRDSIPDRACLRTRPGASLRLAGRANGPGSSRRQKRLGRNRGWRGEPMGPWVTAVRASLAGRVGNHWGSALRGHGPRGPDVWLGSTGREKRGGGAYDSPSRDTLLSQALQVGEWGSINLLYQQLSVAFALPTVIEHREGPTTVGRLRQEFKSSAWRVLVRSSWPDGIGPKTLIAPRPG